MATLIELCEANELVKFEASLDAGEQEWRLIYLLPDAVRWFTDALPEMVSDWNLELTPEEQVDLHLNEFCGGDALAFNRYFKCLKPVGESVWELRPSDVRLFGWFAKRDCFILVGGQAKKELANDSRLVSQWIGRVVRARDALNLDSPKFISGDSPDAVVQDWY